MSLLASRDPQRAEAAVQAHIREAAARLAVLDGAASADSIQGSVRLEGEEMHR